jgi:hypothetical protein
VRFEVLKAACMKMAVFRVVGPRGAIAPWYRSETISTTGGQQWALCALTPFLRDDKKFSFRNVVILCFCSIDNIKIKHNFTLFNFLNCNFMYISHLLNAC